MTPAELDAIDAIAKRAAETWQDDGCGWAQGYAEDVPALVAEVRRLRAIVEAKGGPSWKS